MQPDIDLTLALADNFPLVEFSPFDNDTECAASAQRSRTLAQVALMIEGITLEHFTKWPAPVNDEHATEIHDLIQRVENLAHKLRTLSMSDSSNVVWVEP